MTTFIKKQPPGRIIAFGFLSVIFIGSLLLMLPCCLKNGLTLSYPDALYTSTSAVCVTGLVTVDTGDTFSFLGQLIIMLLMQIGGLGVTAIGAGVILAMGKKMNFKSMNLISESMNLRSKKGIIYFVKDIFITTLAFEIAGAIASFLVFINYFEPLKAIWVSLFHSIAAFNNSGFDILGGGTNLIPYRDNLALNVITCILIISGGIGFLVIKEICILKFNLKKLSMHSKVVLSMSTALIIIGALLIKLTEEISWSGAIFTSVSARTAGFSSYSMATFSKSGILIMTVLMFIGASPGSTGGGVKTTTFFALLQGIKSAATNKTPKAFHYSMPKEAFKKAAIIVFIAISVIFVGTYAISIFDPALSMKDVVFETVSAFGTVGLSTGITSTLSVASKFVYIVIMYIGRLGPLTIATLWYFSDGERVKYPEGNISIG